MTAHSKGKESVSPATLQSSVLPAVTLTVAKRKGTNAIQIADRVIEKVNLLKGTMIPVMST